MEEWKKLLHNHRHTLFQNASAVISLIQFVLKTFQINERNNYYTWVLKSQSFLGKVADLFGFFQIFLKLEKGFIQSNIKHSLKALQFWARIDTWMVLPSKYIKKKNYHWSRLEVLECNDLIYKVTTQHSEPYELLP